VPPTTLAVHFLTGSILTLVLPVALLIAIVVWYVLIFRRRLKD
jgi:hypothetical protein